MNREETLKKLESDGLGRLMPDLDILIEDSIRLVSQPARGDFPVGISRLGGRPDLPEQAAWPIMSSGPMAFVAQLRLEDIARLAPSGWLPQSGWLSFFYDQNQEIYGASPADRGGWQVMYLSSKPDDLRPRPYPDGLSEGARYRACTLTAVQEVTLPGSPSQHLPNMKWSPDEIHRYEDFLAGFPNQEDLTQPHHRMFGHPEQLQDDMQAQSALYANGFTELDDPRAGATLARKTDWKLLLQVDSDYNAGMRWASSGRLYFWIELEALKALAFDRAWAVLQSG